MKSDIIQRFILQQADVRGEVLILHETAQTILSQHAYPEDLKFFVAEALCLAGLLSATLKSDGRISVQFQGQGKMSMLLAQCNHLGEMRAIAKWKDDLISKDIIESLQAGVLAITLEVGLNPYQGIVSWTGNTLEESIENYFRHSEQVPTKIRIQKTESGWIALLLQQIPSNNEIKQSKWAELVKLCASIDLNLFVQESILLVLPKIFPEELIEVFPETTCLFKCSCSRLRGENAISLLRYEEACAELAAKQCLMVNCEFCNTEYEFTKHDVERIFADKNNSTSLH